MLRVFVVSSFVFIVNLTIHHSPLTTCCPQGDSLFALQVSPQCIFFAYYLKNLHMKIGIAADLGGFELKQILHSFLVSLDYDIKDYGAYERNDVDDYPDFVAPLAREWLPMKLKEESQYVVVELGGSYCCQ
jgi:hypothetical protein